MDDQITHVIVELGKFNLRQEMEQEIAEAKQKIIEAQEEKAKAQEESIIKMLSSGLLSDKQIANFQNVSLLRVHEIKRSL